MITKLIQKAAIPGFFLVLLIITLLSLIPQPLPQVPDIPWSDKILHYLAYLVLGFLYFLSAEQLSRKQADTRGGGRTLLFRVFLLSTAVIFAFLYGGAIELLQKYTGRQPELLDLLADISGGFSGGVLSFLFVHFFIHRQG